MTDKPTHVTGGCLCGEVRYEAEVLLKSGFICHCRICQKSTGQPSEITVPIKSGTLIFVKGEPKSYVSSADCQRGFCADCGISTSKPTRSGGWRSIAGRENRTTASIPLKSPAELKQFWRLMSENFRIFPVSGWSLGQRGIFAVTGRLI